MGLRKLRPTMRRKDKFLVAISLHLDSQRDADGCATVPAIGRIAPLSEASP